MMNLINIKVTFHNVYLPKKNIKVHTTCFRNVVRLTAILNVAGRGIAIQIMAYRLNSM